MNILGINYGHPDSSAILLKNGEWIIGSEEERFKRVKHWAGFPEESIKFCLEGLDISFNYLDAIAVAGDTSAHLFKKLLFLIRHPNHLRKSKFVSGGFKNDWKNYFPKLELSKKIRFVEHHRAHLSSAFYGSPFDESLVFSMDGSGDFSTSMWGIGRGNQIDIKGNTYFPHSLGLFYTAASQYLGFHHVGDEYKVMGLSALGKPTFYGELLNMFIIKKDGTFQLKDQYFKWNKPLLLENNHLGYPTIPLFFSNYWQKKWGNTRNSKEEIKSFHFDFAASVQSVFEFILINRLNYLASKYQINNLCLAGGSIQNSLLNGKLSKSTPFENIYIPCATHDAGISLGAAQWIHFHDFRNKREPAIWSSFKGKDFSEEEIRKACEEEKISFSEKGEEELIESCVEVLMSGGIVGWFQGRAEFGPRSLGNRSILANPLVPGIKDKLNLSIKNRERFRPFAISILFEHQPEYLGEKSFFPFMEQVKQLNIEKMTPIKTLLHSDNSLRIHSVRKEENQLFHQLICIFHKKSGFPALINTSFNENEPIVNTPQEAIQCFKRTELDLLIMGRFFIKKLGE